MSIALSFKDDENAHPEDRERFQDYLRWESQARQLEKWRRFKTFPVRPVKVLPKVGCTDSSLGMGEDIHGRLKAVP